MAKADPRTASIEAADNCGAGSDEATAEAEANRRLKFLAAASTLLSSSLDYEHTLSELGGLIVSCLADACFIHEVDEDGNLRPLVMTHGDPAKAAELKALQAQCTFVSDHFERLAAMYRQGEPRIVEGIPADMLRALAGSAAHEPSISAMGFHSAVIVPLATPRRPIGWMTLALARAEQRYGAADLSFAEDLAHRCSAAIENARLYRYVLRERDRAEQESYAKDEFVAVLSHELRNPLVPILGWARILKNHDSIKNDPLLSEGACSLERNARIILRLVEDCLDLARICERKVRLDLEVVDLNSIAGPSVQAIREMAGDKGLDVTLQLHPFPVWVMADRTRLEQVMMNLLMNAVKYTPNGGRIAINCRRLGSEAEIQVQDSGIGIGAEFLEQIFQPFRQGSKRWLVSESGLGLGLAIARQILELHGGRIWAVSEGPGTGSSFNIRLPVTAWEMVSAPAEKDIASLPNRKPACVLLIEDSPDVLYLMKLELEWLGYSVLIAQAAETGLEIARRELPDVIVSDIRMPRMDGYELIQRLRALPELAAKPAIALTGFGMKQDIEAAIQAGFSAHLSKPVSTEDLSALIQRLLADSADPQPAAHPTM